jgi:ABC-type multidrug transport system fused ATPase/permease subunit
MEYPSRPVSGTSLMDALQEPVIRFEHVSFTYPGTTKKILDDISFEIPYGSKTALVGENGAGKSTIIKLVCGLYTPVAGKITINGISAADIPMRDRSKLYSVAFQDYGTYMFPLRENIALGDTARINNDEELNDALKTCFAPELAGKLDRPIGRFDDNSMDLSTGQWQKIALARAQFHPYSVIILDEPTASLDPIAENDLYTSFMQVINRGSCILVSHRLAMARLTDQIIVLDKGRIRETGRHDDLMSRRGLYASMFQAQRQWYEEGGMHDEPEA